MASLSKSNKFLRNVENLHKIVSENCIATAAFEGNRVKKDGHIVSTQSKDQRACKRSNMQSSKKPAKSS